MARTPEGALLTERHRRLQLLINAGAARDLLHLWGTVNPRDLSTTLAPFLRAGLVIVRAGRRASAGAASRYYADFRRLEGVPGQVVITVADLPEDPVIEGALRGAALKGIKVARDAGRSPEEGARTGFVKLAGSATGLVLGGGRETLLNALRGDPQAKGWQRVTDGAPCAFCRMVASRGPVFKHEASADFKAHGHCGCSAEPYFDGSKPLPLNERFRQEWDEATAGHSGNDALNAYRRHIEGRAVAPTDPATG